MAGAWEQRGRPNVLCGILHTEVTTLAWSFGLRNLQMPGDFLPVAGRPYDDARNYCCEAVLNGPFSHLFFLDSDVIPPSDAVLKLLSRNLPVVSGVYFRRSHPHGHPVAIKRGAWLTPFKPNSLVEVDLVGAGCLLIRRDVIEQMKPQRPEAGKKWFDWRVDTAALKPPPDKPSLSEDFTFCHAIRMQMGIKTILDTSVICRHAGFAEATYGAMGPLNTAVQT